MPAKHRRGAATAPANPVVGTPVAVTNVVGTNVPRAEGRDKITGTARYIDDLTMPGLLHGLTLRSTVARGRIVAVERDPDFDWSGFTIVDHRDIPAGGRNVVALLTDDQPVLAAGRVNHREEPILLLAHEDRARLEEGIARIRVVYEPEPAQLDFESATQVLKEIRIDKGDVDAAFTNPELRIIEGTYRTGAQEHVYIEPNGVIAVPRLDHEPTGNGGNAGDGDDAPPEMTVYGSLQCPYYMLRALAMVLGVPPQRVRVVQVTTGGGFGGKEEYPSILAAHAALLARKAGRPVKMIYDRSEDMAATTKRHPSIVHCRTAVTRDGRVVASDIDIRLDGGAYVTLSPVVLSRSCIHAGGPYSVDNVRIRGRVMMTNTPPTGAFRGFGAPQSQFASEVHLDRVARELGIDPVVLRRRNILRPGDSTATGQVVRESLSIEEVLDRALARHARDTASERDSRQSHDSRDNGDDRDSRDNPVSPGLPRPLRATGLALFLHGSGFTGGGEIKLAARAGVELTPDGARVLVGSTEIGQGTRTILAQIVADTLGLPYEAIETADPDTARDPDSGPTVASRTCMIVGRILERAAARLKELVGPYDSPRDFRRRARALLDARGRVAVEESYARPSEMQWSDETYRGDAYGAYAWGCNIADVEVDPITYQARCTRLTTVVDIGKAIHPILVEGQIEGGTLQAIGWALYEDVVMRDGRMANNTLTNYIIPTTLDTPAMAVELVENPYAHGPFGAKGVGEAPMDGPAAAIVNALTLATGRAIDAIPVTPERLMQLLEPAPTTPAA